MRKPLVVVDASVALAWYLPDSDANLTYAIDLRDAQAGRRFGRPPKGILCCMPSAPIQARTDPIGWTARGTRLSPGSRSRRATSSNFHPEDHRLLRAASPRPRGSQDTAG